MSLWYKCALWWTVFFALCFVVFVVFDAPYGPRAGLIAAVPFPLIWIAAGRLMPR